MKLIVQWTPASSSGLFKGLEILWVVTIVEVIKAKIKIITFKSYVSWLNTNFAFNDKQLAFAWKKGVSDPASNGVRTQHWI